jgi:hypothetical protein
MVKKINGKKIYQLQQTCTFQTKNLCKYYYNSVHMKEKSYDFITNLCGAPVFANIQFWALNTDKVKNFSGSELWLFHPG